MHKITLILSLYILLLSATACQAYSNEQIVNAIFKAEGGYKATYLYGIRSISYQNEAEARRICFNTVRNNRKRFANQTIHKEYLNFLASRYCPVGAKNDPNNLNQHWIGNVRYFLEKDKAVAKN